jgi:hypothetical protein
MTTATKTNLSPKSLAAKDAVTQLTADHVRVSGLFAEYDKARSAAKTTSLVADNYPEPSVHTQIEEEIFYRWTSSN